MTSPLVRLEFEDHVDPDARHRIMGQIFELVSQGEPLVLSPDDPFTLLIEHPGPTPACPRADVQVAIEYLLEGPWDMRHPLLAWLSYIATRCDE